MEQAGKNCRVLEFSCIVYKIRFHSFAIRAGRAVEHYDNRFFRTLYYFSPVHISNFNHTASIQSITPARLYSLIERNKQNSMLIDISRSICKILFICFIYSIYLVLFVSLRLLDYVCQTCLLDQ